MSYDMLQESVPGFTPRVGDYLAQGSNNSIIVLGRDRAKAGPADGDSGRGDDKGTGAVHIIVGRVSQAGDPDMTPDAAYVYLSMKTDADTNLGLTGVESNDDGNPAAVMKSDVVRTVFRKSVKVSDDGGKNYLYINKSYLIASVNNFSVKIDSSGMTTTTGAGKLEVQPSQVVVTNGVIKLGGATAADPVVKWIELDAAVTALATAWDVFAAAMTAYTVTIQPLADPTGAGTSVFDPAIAAMTTAVTAFQTAVAAAGSGVVSVTE